ncbi:MAG: hypothetical protein FWD15_00575 [Alphaproteobacteria bacterium]|nr:hypothetical protein [Alphaproteobacteria bacterium]
MKKILALLFVAAFAFCVDARAEFINGFEEIPLMNGLHQGEEFSFDTEEARVVEQYVSSDEIGAMQFVVFYKETLKSLGWTLGRESGERLTFTREGERLEITIDSKKPLQATFLLTPAG